MSSWYTHKKRIRHFHVSETHQPRLSLTGVEQEMWGEVGFGHVDFVGSFLLHQTYVIENRVCNSFEVYKGAYQDKNYSARCTL